MLVDLPIEADPRHRRIMLRDLVFGMVAADRDDEVAAVLAGEPAVEGKPTLEMTARRQDVGLRRQLGLHAEETFLGYEARQQLELDQRDWRHIRRLIGDLQGRQADDVERRRLSPNANARPSTKKNGGPPSGMSRNA